MYGFCIGFMFESVNFILLFCLMVVVIYNNGDMMVVMGG